MNIRRARIDEAQALTVLALRAKASWGYDAAFMEACRAELTMTADKLAEWDVWVAERGAAVLGMIALRVQGGVAEVEDFFVAPEAQGQGVGATLLDRLVRRCRDLGLTVIEVDADPNAEGIYARLGFRTIGRSPSGSIPGRFLPRMQRRLAHTIREASLPQ